MPTKIKRRKPAISRKEETIKVRSTRAEKSALQEAARKAGLDLSAWIRMVALKAAEEKE
jgi:uncharacterized protein (DUF1778 family)